MMFVRNHGTLAQVRSIAEASILMHNLKRSCEIQIAAQSGGPRSGAAAGQCYQKNGVDRVGGWATNVWPKSDSTRLCASQPNRSAYRD
jgi:ribulose-5-phosphate 4-epimerase/fuculose-1-phosphate aldolase